MIKKKRAFFLLTVFALLFSCNETPTNDTPGGPTIEPNIIIPSNVRPFWYTDSLLQDMIYPSTFHCPPGGFCFFVAGLNGIDYTCTALPDTFWGILQYDWLAPETVYCHSDSAWVINDTTVYSLKNYMFNKSNAICSECAIAYSRKGICYQFSAGETRVRLRNSCIDTSFTDDFCLPKLPLDSQDGVWIESIDTFFCPAQLINEWEGSVTRGDIMHTWMMYAITSPF